MDTKSVEKNEQELNFDYIWIDSNINNPENSEYSKKLLEIYPNIALFQNIDNSLAFFTKIKFRITCIIISGSLFPEFILKLKGMVYKISSVPKIIIFSSKNTKTKIESMSVINDSFYNSGGLTINFEQILSFLKNNIINKELIFERKLKREIMETGAEFSFELLDNRKSTIINNVHGFQ